jgi:hypothetical protein
MKTHELSKALTQLARVLKAGPNIDLDDLHNLSTHIESGRKSETVPSGEAPNKGAALALLAQMASYSKPQLVELSASLGIPVEIRSADAVRDVLGKILRYIQDNPGVQTRLISSDVARKSSETTPLMRALAILMNQP